MNTKIFVCTHKNFTPPDDSIYSPLHVGRAISSDLGFAGDDTGDSISEKNKSFCELTGLYWIWKNSDSDIVGLCHYRRYLVKDEAFLTKEYIEKTLTADGYDIIMPSSGWSPYETNEKHYQNIHFFKDYQCLREVLSEKYPEYLPAFDHFSKTNLASLANIMITRKEIFDEYCTWLFDILFEVEKRTDLTGYDTFQFRLYGYLSERLLRIWMFMHTYKIKEEEVRLIDPADADNAIKSVELKYRYVKLFFSDLVKKFENGNIMAPVPNHSSSPDFHGKIPVFVCWWQGLSNMPDLVRMCVESIDKNMPENLTEVHLITLENVHLYVDFPEYIVDKFNRGLISMTHMSDILRMNLLSRYGGLWIDATYYLTKPVPEYIFTDYDFFTLKNNSSPWKADIVQGRWSSNFLYCNKNRLLPQFVLQAFYEYLKVQDSLIDYYFMDYLIALCYDSFEEIKSLIDACPHTNPNVMELAARLNNLYDRSAFEQLTADTCIFKLSHKISVMTENLLGNSTVYGYLLKSNNIL